MYDKPIDYENKYDKCESSKCKMNLLLFKSVILVALVFAVLTGSAGNKVLKRSDVATVLDKWKELIETDGKADGKPVTSSVYNSFASQTGKWLTKNDLEVTTEIPKSWFIRLKYNFTVMAELKRYVEHARIDGRSNSAKVLSKKQQFLSAYDKFIKLKQDMPRFSRKQLNELKRRQKLRGKSGQSSSKLKREPRIRGGKVLDDNTLN
ncbi:MAG: hypothetical protein L3J71_16215 [Victivallaceae bacterium]|nr:hypothetical protein [Victivallaceae bacterium]